MCVCVCVCVNFELTFFMVRLICLFQFILLSI